MTPPLPFLPGMEFISRIEHDYTEAGSVLPGQDSLEGRRAG